MKKIYLFILSALLLSLSQPLFAQEDNQATEKITVVVTDDGVLFNGEPTTDEAVPEQFWKALQINPKIKYSISAKSNKAETITRMQQLSTAIMEYLSQQRLVVGGVNKEESSLRIDIKSDELIVRLGKDELHQLSINEMDSLRGLVYDFISRREVGDKRHFSLADGTEFEHTPNDALIVTLAKERSAEIDSLSQIVTRTISEGFDCRRNDLSEQVMKLPYHELDNISRSVFMAAVPKRTQSNVMQMKVIREIKPENDNRKALDLMRMCLLKADGTFAWEGKSYSFEDMTKVLGVDFDTSKFMLDEPLVAMLLDGAFGVKAPKLADVDHYSLLKVLGLSVPGMMSGFVNMVAHSAKVLKENPDLVDAYVPISIKDFDFVALDASGVEVQQLSQAKQLQVKFTIVGNESSRSENKKLNVSVYHIASGQEFKTQHTAAYHNVDLPIVIPFDLTAPLDKGTLLVSVYHGKKPLGAIEVDMMQ